MTLLNWTFTVLGIGVSWIALVLALFQYFKKRNDTRSHVVKKSMFWGIGTLIVLYGAGIGVWVEPNAVDIYRLRVTVLDPQRIPVEDAKVWSSIGGEPKKVAGGWQFDISSASIPKDGKLIIFASIESVFQKGEYALQLTEDPNPSITIQLQKPTSASVRGIVIDESGRAVEGARINVVGYAKEAVTTLVGGNFELIAYVAEGEEVLLHIEKQGYAAENSRHRAGGKPIEIKLKKDKLAKLHPNTAKDNIEVSQQLSGMIWGEDHNPLAKVIVRLPEFNLTDTTDSNGEFEFNNVKAFKQQSVKLIARKKGFETVDTYATLGNPSNEFTMRREKL